MTPLLDLILILCLCFRAFLVFAFLLCLLFYCVFISELFVIKMEQTNAILTFKCLECFKQFSSKKTLTFHLRTIHEVPVNFKSEDSFICHHCGKSYRHKQSFNRHINRNHPSDSKSTKVDDDETLLSSSSSGLLYFLF